jgi:hypothetical protein
LGCWSNRIFALRHRTRRPLHPLWKVGPKGTAPIEESGVLHSGLIARPKSGARLQWPVTNSKLLLYWITVLAVGCFAHGWACAILATIEKKDYPAERAIQASHSPTSLSCYPNGLQGGYPNEPSYRLHAD